LPHKKILENIKLTSMPSPSKERKKERIHHHFKFP